MLLFHVPLLLFPFISFLFPIISAFIWRVFLFPLLPSPALSVSLWLVVLFISLVFKVPLLVFPVIFLVVFAIFLQLCVSVRVPSSLSLSTWLPKLRLLCVASVSSSLQLHRAWNLHLSHLIQSEVISLQSLRSFCLKLAVAIKRENPSYIFILR